MRRAREADGPRDEWGEFVIGKHDCMILFVKIMLVCCHEKRWRWYLPWPLMSGFDRGTDCLDRFLDR